MKLMVQKLFLAVVYLDRAVAYKLDADALCFC